MFFPVYVYNINLHMHWVTGCVPLIPIVIGYEYIFRFIEMVLYTVLVIDHPFASPCIQGHTAVNLPPSSTKRQGASVPRKANEVEKLPKSVSEFPDIEFQPNFTTPSSGMLAMLWCHGPEDIRIINTVDPSISCVLLALFSC